LELKREKEMRAFEYCRIALSIVSVAALLSACGGRSPVPITTGSAIAVPSGHKNHQTFPYTGSEQTFVVPTGVKRLTVVARGGAGAGYVSYGYTGYPGRVYAIIPVQPGGKLYVFVGASGKDGGFNGGGAGGNTGYGDFKGYNGGGASDVRVGGDKLKDRIIVAAGGGGSGDTFTYSYAYGGDGGGLSGEPGGSEERSYRDSGGGGSGGSQTDGGAGGTGGLGSQTSESGQPGANGALGLGGSGGNGGPGNGCGSYGYCFGLPGGGGGGGYYGGGGGGGGGADHEQKYGSGGQGASGGAGGGSSYVERSAITSRMWTGWRENGDGSVIFIWN
jgi:hypothetical protein